MKQEESLPRQHLPTALQPPVLARKWRLLGDEAVSTTIEPKMRTESKNGTRQSKMLIGRNNLFLFETFPAAN